MATIIVGASLELWEAARIAGFYTPPDYAAEGFIHASTPRQLPAVAAKHYHGRSNLVLLYVDAAMVRAEIRYEGRAGGEQYPHIYGPLNVDAVIEAVEVTANADGSYTVPEAR
ncbi:MAG: hypothetical protein JWO42_384 [Chloroflexi bacterium]|nr:hypothetical protein [Chloroflexota bacterium]